MKGLRRASVAAFGLAAILAGAEALAAGAGADASAQETAATAEQAPTPAASGAVVYRVPLTGVVEMGLAPFIQRSLDEAERAGAAALVLDIDTPGGRVDAAEQIVDAIGDAAVPVYAYVNRRALSAGALIAMAADDIYMRPGATIGAATPVTGEGSTASEKVVSAMRSAFRSLAQARGLDPRVAEAMVDESIEIPGVVEAGNLLTLSTTEAVELGYAQETAEWESLMVAIGSPAAEVVQTSPNWAERIVRFFTNPLVAPFLLSLGFLGLLIEIKTPAFGLAGLAGLSSLGLFFGSHFIIGLAGWEVALLLGLGLTLILVELLVIPGVGVAGVLGLVAVVASIFLSLVGRFPTTGDVLIALNVLGASLLLVAFAAWQLIRRLPEDRRGRNLLHREVLTRELGYTSAKRRDELVGLEGVTLTDLRPAGTARVGAEKIDVVSDGPWVASGTPVRILRSEGYRHVVEPVANGGGRLQTGETPEDGEEREAGDGSRDAGDTQAAGDRSLETGER
ncbi:MAG: NfeD family protein [Gemmatimonadota bacterium]